MIPSGVTWGPHLPLTITIKSVGTSRCIVRCTPSRVPALAALAWGRQPLWRVVCWTGMLDELAAIQAAGHSALHGSRTTLPPQRSQPSGSSAGTLTSPHHHLLCHRSADERRLSLPKHRPQAQGARQRLSRTTMQRRRQCHSAQHPLASAPARGPTAFCGRSV